MHRETKDRFTESTECQRAHAVLEEELLGDGHLTDEQRDLLEQHLRSCADCAAYAGFVRRLPDLAPAPSTAEISRATVGARMIYFARRRRIRVAAASIAVIAAAASVLLFFQFLPASPGEPASGDEIDLLLVSGSVNLDEPITSPGALSALGREVIALEHATRLAAGDFATIALNDRAEIEPLVLERDAVELRLHDGMIAVYMPSDISRAIRFVVHTTRATVKVTGTVFCVEVVGDDVRVDVVRGAVEVRRTGLEAGTAIMLAAGHTLSLATNSVTTLDTAASERILELVGGDGSARQTAEPIGHLDEALRDGREQPAEFEPITDLVGRDVQPRRSDVAGGKQKPSASGTATGDAATPAGNDPEGLLAAARRCRTDRDWTCAAASYQRVVELYPGQPEAKIALVSLAEIQLRHLGRPGQALVNFERYQATSPGGPLAEEALYGICRALLALGRDADERRSLEQFLDQHPSSLRASKAKARLDEFSGKGE